MHQKYRNGCAPGNRLKLSNLKHKQIYQAPTSPHNFNHAEWFSFIFNPFKVNDRLASKEKDDFNTNCPLATSFDRGILVSSFLFFHTWNAYVEHIFLQLLSSPSPSPSRSSVPLGHLVYFRLLCFSYAQSSWHCCANKIDLERFHENQNESMKNVNWCILMKWFCWCEKHIQQDYVANIHSINTMNEHEWIKLMVTGGISFSYC